MLTNGLVRFRYLTSSTSILHFVFVMSFNNTELWIIHHRTETITYRLTIWYIIYTTFVQIGTKNKKEFNYLTYSILLWLYTRKNFIFSFFVPSFFVHIFVMHYFLSYNIGVKAKLLIVFFSKKNYNFFYVALERVLIK